MELIKTIYSGVYNLILGLTVTVKHMGKHAVTLQYPKERWTMPERSRGCVVLLSDPETEKLRCIACGLCYKTCPNNAIKFSSDKDEAGKRFAQVFEVDTGICIYCGLCEEICPVKGKAIKLVPLYEFSVYDKKDLIYNKEKLAQIGRPFSGQANPNLRKEKESC
jgi:NADH-quinone oxidoreductase subunit I